MLVARTCFLRSPFRQFWNSLDIISNKYDRERAQELGADRACAEWLVRCGGGVRFQNWGSFVTKRNALPSGTPGHFQVEEIRAINAGLTSEGFAHLEGLTQLKKMHLEKCEQIDDSALARCNQVKNSLESIVLIDLVQITGNGLAYLAGLKNLKQIDLAHLTNVKNREAVLKLLQNELPQCRINYSKEFK